MHTNCYCQCWCSLSKIILICRENIIWINRNFLIKRVRCAFFNFNILKINHHRLVIITDVLGEIRVIKVKNQKIHFSKKNFLLMFAVFIVMWIFLLTRKLLKGMKLWSKIIIVSPRLITHVVFNATLQNTFLRSLSCINKFYSWKLYYNKFLHVRAIFQ